MGVWPLAEAETCGLEGAGFAEVPACCVAAQGTTIKMKRTVNNVENDRSKKCDVEREGLYGSGCTAKYFLESESKINGGTWKVKSRREFPRIKR